MQVASLTASAATTDASLIVAHAIILAANIIAVPWLLWIATYHAEYLLAALIVEIIIDKSYIILSLVSKVPSNEFSHLGFICHGDGDADGSGSAM